MHCCLRILIVAVVFLSVGPVQASLIISIGSLTLEPGQRGELDVLIHSDSRDAVERFNFEFRIEQLGLTSTQLRFLNPQDDLQLHDSNYLFAGGSLKRDGDVITFPPFPPIPPIVIDPAPVGNVSSTGFPDDTFIGGDISTLGAVTVPRGSSPALLATLQVIPGSGTLAPQDGDSFGISLIEGANTFFRDASGDEIRLSSTSGTVTIAAPDSVVIPEPGSLTLFGLGSVGLLGALWRRQRGAVGG